MKVLILFKHSRKTITPLALQIALLLPGALAAEPSAAEAALVPLPPTSMAALSQGALERPHSYTLRTPEQQAAYTAWKWSLVAVASSQALDIVSSYNMREVNPLLQDGSGRFGMKATSIKLSVTAAVLAGQYWMLNRHPARARKMALLNFAAAALTSAFAAHNFSIR
jgi:hypothetical protein